LIVAGGTPVAIASSAMAGRRIFIARALDPLGLSWTATPQAITAADSAAYVVAAGTTPDGGLKLITNCGWDNTLGAYSVLESWLSPAAAIDRPLFQGRVSLPFDSGEPYVSFGEEGQPLMNLARFNDKADGKRYFAVQRSLDSYGAVWGAPQLIPGTTQSESNDGTIYPRCALIDNRPCVAYRDDQALQLICRWASDPYATAWGAQEIIDCSGRVGDFYALLDDHGKPVVAYTAQTPSTEGSSTPLELRVARRK
jgi:hypothetical protein